MNSNPAMEEIDDDEIEDDLLSPSPGDERTKEPNDALTTTPVTEKPNSLSEPGEMEEEPSKSRASKTQGLKRYKPMRSISSFFRKPRVSSKKQRTETKVSNTTNTDTTPEEDKTTEPKENKNTDNIKKDACSPGIKATSTSIQSVSTVDAKAEPKDKESSSTALKMAQCDDMIEEEASEEEEEEEEEVEEMKEVSSTKATKAKANMDPGNSLGYHPVKSAPWMRGKSKIPYRTLAKVFHEVESTSKRLTKTRLVANYLRSVIAMNPEFLIEVFYLCCNKIAPQYEGLELGIGDSIVLKALSEATGTSVKKLKEELGTVGDIGTIAQSKRNKQRTMFPVPPLEVGKVFNTLVKLAKTSGKNSGTVKKDLIKKMLVACKEYETKYIIRCLQGNLRIGLAAQTVQAALAQAVVLTPPGSKIMDASKKMSKEQLEESLKAADQIIKQAFIEVPNYDHVIKMLLKHGLENLSEHCQLTPGIPIKAMLGKPATGISELFTKFVDVLFTVEFKYDGERAQIHFLPDGTIKIFSRNSEDNTGKYPDLIQDLSESFATNMQSFIIDCEVVAWDSKNKKILPFQTLSTRKRKDVSSDSVQVNVVLFAFDCIYLNGKSLINEQFATRRQALRENFKEVDGKFFFAKGKDINNPEEIEEFLKLSVESSCEGLMVKALDKDAKYVPDKRNWVKVKKDYLEGMSDSLDLVPIGAFKGKGKRAGWYGCFLLACYDSESGIYV